MPKTLRHPAENAPDGGACPLLHRIPMEVREMIYQYTIMEKVENRMDSREV